MPDRPWSVLPAVLALCVVSARGVALGQSGSGTAAPPQAVSPAGERTSGASSATPADTPEARQDEQAAEEELQAAEPDFTLINLQTTLRLPRHRAYFRVAHRFNRDLLRGSFGDVAGDLFGLDNGAVIGLEFRFGIFRHLDAGIYRASLDKTVQLLAKYDGWHQGGAMPLSISGIVSVEGGDNFQERYAPAVGGVVGRTIGDRAAVYVSPVWVNNTAELIGIDRNTFYLGVGARVRVLKTVYVVAEAAPRLAGYAPGTQSYGFAVEKLQGGHVFQLNFSNTTATTVGQLARGGIRDSFYLGFNITRKF
jgi:hypothetical protein